MINKITIRIRLEWNPFLSEYWLRRDALLDHDPNLKILKIINIMAFFVCMFGGGRGYKPPWKIRGANTEEREASKWTKKSGGIFLREKATNIIIFLFLINTSSSEIPLPLYFLFIC